VSDAVSGTNETLASTPGLEPTLDSRGLRGAQESTLGRGHAIGRFTIIDQLGMGGMGVVLAAYDPVLDRRVAIKVLRHDDGSTVGHARLLREAQSMAKLTHPNVVTVYEVGELGDQVFVAMEYLDGGTLTAWLAGAPPRSDRISTLIAAGRGLAAAHAAGMVHRDFKPDNVLLGKDGRVRVTDFGLAGTGLVASGDPTTPVDEDVMQAETLAGTSKETLAGQLVGTPAYMAPEQHDCKTVDARADQFAFCVSLYQALCGRHPFGGSTYAEIAAAVRLGAVREPPADTLTPRLRAIIWRGLSVDPDARYPDMTTLLAELAHDPSIRRRRIATLGAFGTVALAAVLVARGGGNDAATVEPPCQGMDAKLAGVWDAPTKARIHAAFTATGLPIAEPSWARIESRIDGYAGSLVAMRKEACEATAVRREQSAQLLDLRMACLDGRSAELAAFVGALGQASLDGPTVLKGVEVSRKLAPIAPCADAKGLATEFPLPDDPARRAAIEAAEVKIAAIEAEQRFGKYAKAIEHGKELTPVVAALEHPPTAARLGLVIGYAAVFDSSKDSDAILRAAILAAARAHDDRRVALAWGLLLSVMCDQHGKIAEGLALDTTVEAAVLRTGDTPETRGLYLQNLAVCTARNGDQERAIELSEAAIAARTIAHGPESFEVANVLTNLSDEKRMQEDLDGARGAMERALAIHRALLGDEHPLVASDHQMLANVVTEQGKFDEAEMLYRRARAIHVATLGEGHEEIKRGASGLCDLLMWAGRYDAAIEECKRAFSDDPERRDIYDGAAMGQLAKVYMAAGRPREAIEPATTAVGIFAKALAKNHAGHVDEGVILGEALALSGDAKTEAYYEALLARAKADGINPLRIAKLLVFIGDFYRRSGRYDAAWSRYDEAATLQGGASGTGGLGLARIRAEQRRCKEALELFAKLPAWLGNERDAGTASCQLELGNAAGALAAATAAVSGFERFPGKTPLLLADARFQLARASWETGDRAGATVLAGKVRAAYQNRPDVARLRTVFETWAAARGL